MQTIVKIVNADDSEDRCRGNGIVEVEWTIENNSNSPIVSGDVISFLLSLRFCKFNFVPLPINRAEALHPINSSVKCCAESSVAATPALTSANVWSATNLFSFPEFPPLLLDDEQQHSNPCILFSNSSMSTVMLISSAINCVSSTRKPIDVYNKFASSKEKTLSSPTLLARSWNFRRPLSRVFEKDSSSSLTIAVIRACYSGKVFAINSTKNGHKLGKEYQLRAKL